MATPSQVHIDDRDPLIFYSPNSSWVRGGNVSDYGSSSTWTSSPGASATIVFTGTEISVLGTIQYLQSGVPAYVLSSYSVDNGPTTIHNATEMSQFQFQQKLFLSDTLTSTSHTLVVTHLANNAAYFIDYFLVTPSDPSATTAPIPSSPATLPSNLSAPTTLPSNVSAPASLPASLPTTPSSNVSSPSHSPAALSTNTAIPDGVDAKSHSSDLPIGAIVGGSLGALALLGFALFAFWFIRLRMKESNSKSSHLHPDPFVNRARETEQYWPNVSVHQATPSNFSHPTSATPSPRMMAPSKAGERAVPSSISSGPLENRSDSHILSDSMEPPEYDE